jgi:hypothetical protein
VTGEVDDLLYESDGDVDYDHRITSGNGYYSRQTVFTLEEKQTKSPAEYFLYFLPVTFLTSVVILNINSYAQTVVTGWTDVDWPEH